MTIIFFGSDPWFSPPVLEAISKAGHEVLAIVTKGEMRNEFSKLIELNKLETLIIEGKNQEDISLERLDSLIKPLTINSPRGEAGHQPSTIILAAFGPPFLPKEVLSWPKYGCLNVHASLLPRWRGASPVFGAIANGDKETGVSIMRMTEEIDLGPVLGQKKIEIKGGSLKETPLRIVPDAVDDDNRETLTKKLGILGGELIVETLNKLETGQVKEIQQPTESPTPYTHRLTKNSGKIDWKKSPEEIERFIRAVTPWPGAWTEYRAKGQGTRDKGKMLKILKTHLLLSPSLGPQPSALGPDLVIDEVQLPGKNPINWKAFLAGHPGAKFVN